MLDLIKMDLYRMFKMRSLLVIAVIYTFYVFLFTMSEKSYITVQSGIIEMVSSFLPMLLICIFTVLFITYDTHSGFIKSYIGQLPSRVYRLVSKLVCCFIYQFLFFIYMFVIQFVFCALLCNQVDIGDINELLSFSAVTFIIIFAITCVLLMLSSIFRTHVMPLIASICISLGVTRIVMMLVHSLLRNVFELDFNPMKYLLTTQLDILCKEYGEFSLFAMLVDESYSPRKIIFFSLVYISVSIAITLAVFRKKDVA